MRNALGYLAMLAVALSACSRGGADDHRAPPAKMMMPPDTPAPSPSDPCKGVPVLGRCVDAKTVQACFVDEKGRASISTTPCNASETCVSERGESFCKLTAPCREGLNRCTPAGYEQCVAGRWLATSCSVGTACQRFPGLGVECVPLGSSVTVTGQLQYQFRVRRTDFLGFDPTPIVANARRVFVIVVESGRILGSGIADDTGRFSVPAYRTPGFGAQIVFLPVLFYDTDIPAMAVAQPSGNRDDSYRRSPALWSFSVSNLPAPRAGRIDVGGWLVTAESSGALHIFDWLLYGFDRSQALFGYVPQESIAVLWSPTQEPSCGACFRSRGLGGTDVGTSMLHFDTTMELGGTPSSPSHWATSVINHEFGHYMMDQFSRSPGEGGPHGIAQVSSPGLAWSEGFATFSGQAALSRAAGTQNPIYFDVQEGTAFWVDISQGSYFRGLLPRPNPYGSIDQGLNENYLAGMLWDLWNSYGDSAVFRGMVTPRLLGPLNRGYRTVDLVDYADGLTCEGLISASGISDMMRRQQFPWDARPLCR